MRCTGTFAASLGLQGARWTRAASGDRSASGGDACIACAQRLRGAFRRVCKCHGSANPPGAAMAIPQASPRALERLSASPAAGVTSAAGPEAALRSVLASVLPGLAPPDTLMADLMVLHERFTATGCGDYDPAAFVWVLCNHARIRDFAQAGDARAMEGLGALAATLRDSVEGVRDGLPLNALVGQDNRIDNAIQALRTQRVQALMAHAGGDAHGAAALVALEAEQARLRNQLQNALALAGMSRAMGSTSGWRLTPALVTALRHSLGNAAPRVGLLLAAMLAVEREIAALDADESLRHALAAAARNLRGRGAGESRDSFQVREDIRYLEQRAAGLQPDVEAPFAGGLTPEELSAIGLTPAHHFEALPRARQLAGQGLSSAAEAGDALRTVRNVLGGWQRSGGWKRLAGHGLGVLRGERAESRARRLATRMETHARETLAPSLQLLRGARHMLGPSRDAQDRERWIAGMGLSDALRDVVRAAVLAVYARQPLTLQLHQFDPLAQAQAVRDQLAQWGVDVSLVAHEIDARLVEGMPAECLDDWARDAGLPADSPAAVPADAAGEKDALLAAVGGIQLGTRMRLIFGDRVEVQTGAIPLDPAGLFDVNVKGAGARFGGLEIGRYIDAYELVFREGREARLGVEASAGIGVPGPAAEARVFAGGEGAGHRAGGVALRFPNTPQGAEALRATLERLLGRAVGEPVEIAHLAGAGSIVPLQERKVGGKGGAGVKAGVGLSDARWGWLHSRFGHVGASARGALQAGKTRTRYEAANTLDTVRKTERVVSYELAGTAGLYLKATPRGDGEVEGGQEGHGAAHTVASPALEAGLTVAMDIKLKTKLVLGNDGLVRPGTERLAQKYAGRSGMAALRALGGPAFDLLMERLREDPAQAGAVRAIESVAANAGSGELLSIASTLDPGVAARVNDLHALARNMRSGRAGALSAREAEAQAALKDAQARALLDDARNYNIARISLIPAPERQAALTRLNLAFVQFSTYSEDRGEFVAMEVKPDPAIAAQVRQALAR